MSPSAAHHSNHGHNGARVFFYIVRYGHIVRDTYIGPSSWLGGVSCPYRTGVMRTSENTIRANFREFIFPEGG